MSRARALGFRAALSDLYKIYWYSLFAYVGRGGHATEGAQGADPGFFLRLLEHKTLGRADPLKDRFRSFLLDSFQPSLGSGVVVEVAQAVQLRVDRWRCSSSWGSSL
jgi:hypothetical protein